MDENIDKDRWVKKVNFLTQALILSGALNIGFFATFLYSVLKEKPSSTILLPVSSEKNVKEYSNSEYLSYLCSLNYRELLSLLSNKQLVEEGYTKRDLALGCLVTFHDFNIKKAVSTNFLLQRREIIFFKNNDEKIEMTLFSGLSDYHYEGIIHYAYLEKWPLTSKGLYNLLKKWKKPRDKSLEQACIVTHEYEVIRTLFNANKCLISSDELLDLLSEVNFEMIDNFVKEQERSNNISDERRREFLIYCLNEKSKISAKLLLHTDFLYITKKVDDNTILNILSLLDDQTDEIEQFCVELLKSTRSDEIRKNSAKKIISICK